ncbi:MAG: hypothetical protein GX605_02135 [Chloroflexi bacterium]|nr:hypothetical protein [Chloroflexota bacterium]
MEKKRVPPASVDDYIAGCSPEVRETLQTLRRTIRQAAPEAEERISYGMPTFALHGNLVHFAAHPHHIGFYPAPSGIEAFRVRLSAYKGGKGSVQFPVGQPLPYDLIAEIVRFRVAENIKLAEERQAKAKRRR